MVAESITNQIVGALSRSPPPFRLTGDSLVDWAAFLFAYFMLLYFLAYCVRVLRLARDSWTEVLANLSVAAFIYVISNALLHGVFQFDRSKDFLAYAIAIAVFVAMSSVRRSRYIPASVKRAVIVRDLKGKRFDPKMHHIDHIWPYHLGGSHTVDNLRVLTKADNQRKGRRRPRLREML